METIKPKLFILIPNYMFFGLGFQEFIQSFVTTNIKNNVSADQKRNKNQIRHIPANALKGLFSKHTLILVISSKVALIP